MARNNIDDTVFDLVEGGQKIDLFKGDGYSLTDYENMSAADIKAHLKSNHKIKDILDVVASNPVFRKKLGMDLKEHESWKERTHNLLAEDKFRDNISKPIFNQERLKRIYNLGFGKEEGDVVELKEGINFMGHSGGLVPDYVGYFDPKTWGTGQ